MELARRVGQKKSQDFLNKIKYGSKLIGHNEDSYWLGNSLKISAVEQVDLLMNFYNYRLPFSSRNIDIVKKILPEEKYSASLLKYKTGTGQMESGTWIGWIVGYVEKKGGNSFFAFNIEAETYEEVSKLRNESSRQVLRYFNLID